MNNEGTFKIKKVIDLAHAIAGSGDLSIVGEADLTFQHGQHIIQYEYTKPENRKKEPVNPGIYNFTSSQNGIDLVKIELRPRKLLTSIINTKRIVREANTFFNKLDIYDKLNRPKKRGVLLYSAPGLGKTSAISYFSSEMVVKDSGTVILNWPTDQVKASEVAAFLSEVTEFTKECTKLVLIIEDIGGGAKDAGTDRSVPSSLLNLLDGVNVVFKLPTFIVATTNHPENLLGALANRPGRFDLMLELKPPSAEERVELLKFIAGRDITIEEITAISSDDAKDFSIAHIEEVVVRSMLHDKSIEQVVVELAMHGQKFKKGFEDATKKMGFGASRSTDDDFDFDYGDD